MAEVEALLREAEEERDAVRGAMKVVEGENGRLRELEARAAKKAEEKATEEGTKTEDVAQTPLKGHGKTEVSAKGTKWEVVEPEAQPKPEPNKVQASPANESEPEPQDAEPYTDNAHTWFESARADSATKESSPIVSPASNDDELDEPPSNDGHLAKPVADITSMPGSSKPYTDNAHTWFESARADSATKESSPIVSPASSDDELDNDGHLAKPVADIPSMPGSSSDLWKGQVRDREVTPPKTPPHVHPLPVETSPWAEGRA
ncbi:hypothetical protein RSAG8_13301, partial [Rhizoctonia solani AG-8 WAC10335]